MSFCIITESFLLRKSAAGITCTNTGSHATAYVLYTKCLSVQLSTLIIHFLCPFVYKWDHIISQEWEKCRADLSSSSFMALQMEDQVELYGYKRCSCVWLCVILGHIKKCVREQEKKLMFDLSAEERHNWRGNKFTPTARMQQQRWGGGGARETVWVVWRGVQFM